MASESVKYQERGTTPIAVDVINGVKHQRIKMQHGAAVTAMAEAAAEYEATQLALAYLQGLLIAIEELDDDEDVELAATYVARYLQ